jgi:hypothetical protein
MTTCTVIEEIRFTYAYRYEVEADTDREAIDKIVEFDPRRGEYLGRSFGGSMEVSVDGEVKFTYVPKEPRGLKAQLVDPVADDYGFISK